MHLFLHADKNCFHFSTRKNAIEIGNNLNYDFSDICEWFGDNKLRIYFGLDKSKSIPKCNI